MISDSAGQNLFILAFMQELKGDVLEVGSFQGKSTFFLGTAVKYSQNGKLIAVDHFKGNKGKEAEYKVKKTNLSDLEDNFKNNIRLAKLDSTVKLINSPNDVAVNSVEDLSLRMLFIDGDHTAQGVRKDIQLFLPKVKPGGIVVFDDYDSVHFEGLVKELNNFIIKKSKKCYPFDRMMFVTL